ncbi:hypothetical protein SO802_005080 [Lithocarpus litseifolius]|uniref:Dilute domain-containing protein n=1 Tax=Lithocarpus litseifolius TaxID=425828 RepID=A0AAW2DHL0_9ROSI
MPPDLQEEVKVELELEVKDPLKVVLKAKTVFELQLAHCKLEPCNQFNFFQLKSLNLDDVYLDEQVLTLEACEDLNVVEVDIPNLVSLHCKMNKFPFCSFNTPSLQEVELKFVLQSCFTLRFDNLKELVEEFNNFEESLETLSILSRSRKLLEALLQSETHIAEETKQAYAVEQAKNGELNRKLEDAEKKVDQLQDSVQRLEEKLTNLQSENQVMRQQALPISPKGKVLSARPKTTIIQRTPENGNVQNGEIRKPLDSIVAVPNSREATEAEEKPQKSLNEKQQHWTSRACLVKGRAQANAAAQQALIAHWQSIVKCIDNYLKIMRANHVPPFLVCKLFAQIFSFINVQLFNSLLLRRECCSFSNGEYLKAGLAELEQWCHDATEEFVGLAWDEMKHIRQAVGFLVIHQKPKKTLKEITNDLCPVLSIQQLYRISTMYWDDKYGTHSVSIDVTGGKFH